MLGLLFGRPIRTNATRLGNKELNNSIHTQAATAKVAEKSRRYSAGQVPDFAKEKNATLSVGGLQASLPNTKKSWASAGAVLKGFEPIQEQDGGQDIGGDGGGDGDDHENKHPDNHHHHHHHNKKKKHHKHHKHGHKKHGHKHKHRKHHKKKHGEEEGVEAPGQADEQRQRQQQVEEEQPPPPPEPNMTGPMAHRRRTLEMKKARLEAKGIIVA